MRMKRYKIGIIITSTILGSIILSGCINQNGSNQGAPSSDVTEQLLATEDFTQDGVAETINIVPTDIRVNAEFTETYPDTFQTLYVRRADNTEMLRIDSDGITAESGSTVPALIENRAAYAMTFESTSDVALLDDVIDNAPASTLDESDVDVARNGPAMIVIQINASGDPVSEPITIYWDTTNQIWILE